MPEPEKVQFAHVNLVGLHIFSFIGTATQVDDAVTWIREQFDLSPSYIVAGNGRADCKASYRTTNEKAAMLVKMKWL